MSQFKLPFEISEVPYFAGKYAYSKKDTDPIAAGEKGNKQGILTKAQFLTIVLWKSSRPRKRHERNTEAEVERVTRLAFKAEDDDLRVLALTMLHGVEWRTATAILHLVFPDKYPLADVNAFATLRATVPTKFDAAVWKDYIEFCKAKAKQAGVTLREFDKALWAYEDIQKKDLRRRSIRPQVAPPAHT